ncbi:hypothetical protein L596_018351 [Steinernema carpocapsae]|uniref:RRM domain-containing protein n=1 Tax=Steinernema carpocapsae TaxID=34508 RepID=A0A4U5N4N6_STECR|nr:hypothetical protein L596_018351 [Steinernema carpocapsae]
MENARLFLYFGESFISLCLRFVTDDFHFRKRLNAMVTEVDENRSREASVERNGREREHRHHHKRDKDRSEKRKSRSRSPRERRRRSRSGSNRSRTYDSDEMMAQVQDARLHISDLDQSVRRRDIEDLFSKYGRLEDIWLATYPPIYAFVVFESRRDAAKALKELRTCQIRHCRVRVSAALPRRRTNSERRPPPRSGGGGGYGGSRGGSRRSRSPRRRSPPRRRSRSRS